MTVDVEENSKFRIETAKTLLEEKIKQVPIDKEQFFILEEIYKWKIQIHQLYQTTACPPSQTLTYYNARSGQSQY